MKRVVCELCDCMDFIKDGGLFVCQGCGTKYTAEEARGIMREVDTGTAPGSVAPAAPVAEPGRQQADNILLLATAAYEAENYPEAEHYCNRAIELDALSFPAWFLKGQAVGWSSGMDHPRLEEAAHFFCKAIDFAPESEKERLRAQAVDQLRALGLARIKTRQGRFSDAPTKEELAGFTRDRDVLLQALTVLPEHGNGAQLPEGYPEEVAAMMNEAGVAALNMAHNAWGSLEHPSDQDLSTFIDWCANIEGLFREAISASSADEEADVERYRNLALAIEAPIGKHSQDQYWDPSQGEHRWQDSQCLAEAAVQARRKNAKAARDQADAIQRRRDARQEEEKQARSAAYREAHTDDRQSLEAEKQTLADKIRQLDQEIAGQNQRISAYTAEKLKAVPSEKDRTKIKDQIRELFLRRADLGVFSGRAKQQVDEQITALEARLEALKKKIADEKKVRDTRIDEKIAPATARKQVLQRQLAEAKKRMDQIDAILAQSPRD